MAESLTQQFGSSVALFRYRAESVFQTFAYEWSILHGVRISEEDVRILTQDIITAFWSVLHRNPNVGEWTRAYLMYHETRPPLVKIVKDLLPLHADRDEKPLNMLKPWWGLFQLAGRDHHVATQTFAHATAVAFTQIAGHNRYVPEDADYTDRDVMRAYIKSLLPEPSRFRKLVTWLTTPGGW